MVLSWWAGSSHRTLALPDREGSQLSKEDAGITQGWESAPKPLGCPFGKSGRGHPEPTA